MERIVSANGRLLLLASVVAAAGFYFGQETGFPSTALIAWKGGAVGLLAAYALQWRTIADFRLLALVMALSALGDMVLEVQFQLGGLCFLASHIAAISLYLRHRRFALTQSQKIAGVALLILTPAIAFLLPADRVLASNAALYALALGGMASAAWLSRFPRYRVGLGAVLFVVSDLLVFAEMGPLAGSTLPGLLIWPTYYAGQFLICTGVASPLRRHASG